MKQQIFFSFALLVLVFFLHCSKTLGQALAPGQPLVAAPPAQPPSAATPTQAAAPPPTNVTKILEKAGHFTIFIRLLKATQQDNHLLTVLNNSNNGLTIFAPSDGAFLGLKSGTLNTLGDEAKTEMVKFHIIPTFLSMSQFQTVTNPVATEAGTGSRLALNVTTYPNSVNITTGLTNTSISGTVYTDNQLAIYRVENVLLPMDIFTPKPPAPAPAPLAEKPKKKAPVAQSQSPVAQTVDTSDAGSFTGNQVVFFAIGILAVMFTL